jgi:hypothetical protein
VLQSSSNHVVGGLLEWVILTLGGGEDCLDIVVVRLEALESPFGIFPKSIISLIAEDGTVNILPGISLLFWETIATFSIRSFIVSVGGRTVTTISFVTIGFVTISGAISSISVSSSVSSSVLIGCSIISSSTICSAICGCAVSGTIGGGSISATIGSGSISGCCFFSFGMSGSK